MKIAFLVERNIFFRIFGPGIDKALEKGHEVFCLHDYSQPKTGSKGYQFPSINQTPQFNNGKVVSLDFKSKKELIERCLQNNIQAVISLNATQGNFDLMKELKLKGIYWLALQNGFDTVAISGNYLAMPDKFFIYSWEWLECIFDYLKRINQTESKSFQQFQGNLKDKIEAVGFWGAEPRTIVNPLEIRDKWGIPAGKKVVLLLPFPFGSSLKRFWTKHIFGGYNRFLQLPLALASLNKRWITQALNQENDYRVCLAIKKFCEQNNGYLLVKSRQKDPVRKYLKKIADKVLYDEEFYPPLF